MHGQVLYSVACLLLHCHAMGFLYNYSFMVRANAQTADGTGFESQLVQDFVRGSLISSLGR